MVMVVVVENTAQLTCLVPGKTPGPGRCKDSAEGGDCGDWRGGH